jgi:hypothetical protein
MYDLQYGNRHTSGCVVYPFVERMSAACDVIMIDIFVHCFPLFTMVARTCSSYSRKLDAFQWLFRLQLWE